MKKAVVLSKLRAVSARCSDQSPGDSAAPAGSAFLLAGPALGHLHWVRLTSS